MDIEKFEVGESFPIPTPAQEGAFMELWGDRLVCVINMPGVTREKKLAFKKSFRRYSYLEWPGPVPVAVFVFKFPAPHGPIDCNFNARIVRSEWVDKYLDASAGVENLITFFFLDGQILKAMEAVELQIEVVEMFQNTVRKQLAKSYTQEDYDQALAEIYRHSIDELFRIGKEFRHK